MTPTPRMHQARPSAGVFATSLQNVLLAGPASVSPGSTHALIRGVSGRFGRTRRPRTAFVLSGGASLGALQVGMLRALYERGIAPDLLVALLRARLMRPSWLRVRRRWRPPTSLRRSGTAFGAKMSSPWDCVCSSPD
jgi:hypothetical protein